MMKKFFTEFLPLAVLILLGISITSAVILWVIRTDYFQCVINCSRFLYHLFAGGVR